MATSPIRPVIEEHPGRGGVHVICPLHPQSVVEVI
jgi:hypothetical protein